MVALIGFYTGGPTFWSADVHLIGFHAERLVFLQRVVALIGFYTGGPTFWSVDVHLIGFHAERLVYYSGPTYTVSTPVGLPLVSASLLLLAFTPKGSTKQISWS